MAIREERETSAGKTSSGIDWSTFPFAFLGYGFLYAWGYVGWDTSVLNTLPFTGTTLDMTWFTSAITVPAALVILALIGRRRDLDDSRILFVFAPISAILGTLLSVVYRFIPAGQLALAAAITSGLLTGIASALFILLWGLILSRLNLATLEMIIPCTYIISVLCALIVPSLELASALIVAMLIAGFSGVSLIFCRHQLRSGHVDERYLEESSGIIDLSDEVRTFDIGRMLVYACIVWVLTCVISNISQPSVAYSLGIDLPSFIAYLLAIGFSFLIIRFAIRVDFGAFAYMALGPVVLSMVLVAFGTPVTAFIGWIVSTALGVAFDIILLLYFIRVVQWKRSGRAFYLAMWSCAGYLGIFIGTVFAYLMFSGQSLPENVRMAVCLICILIYVFAVLLIPQRHPYAVKTHEPVTDEQPTGTGDDKVSVLEYTGDAIDTACVRVAGKYRLSTREAQMCVYLAHGRSQTYIRDALYLSKNTVATHTRHLYTKLGVHSKQELIDLVESYE